MKGICMRVLNLLSSGGVGGIEQLCKNIGKYADYSNTFCFLFEEGLIYEEMRLMGLDVISLVETSKKKFTLYKWRKLCELVEYYDIVVIHHCSIALQTYYLLLGRRFKQKKYIMTLHSCFEKKQNYNYGSRIKNKCAEFALKSALNNSDKIIFVSNAGKESYIKNFKIEDGKTTVIYNGIELPDCHVSGKSQDYYQITYIGRIEEVKGLQLLIDAIPKLLENNYNVKVWIIGEGSYSKELQEKVKRERLEEYIKFWGAKRDIEWYLLRTDVFVYPSVCEEVFGISIVEAMSCGVPCVSNQVGGIPEIIENDMNGYISESKSGKGVSDAISKVLDKYEKNTILEMKKNCIETAEKFSIQKTVQGLKREFMDLLTVEKVIF